MFAKTAVERWHRLLTLPEARVATPPGAVLPGERGWALEAGVVWYWYDVLCPFSYVGQDLPGILHQQGLRVIGLPLQLRPEIPPGGIPMGSHDAALREILEQEAHKCGLELRWPARLPYSRPALAALEWVREQEPSAFTTLQSALFRAHFVSGEDIEARSVIEAHAAASGVYLPFLREAMADGSADAAVTRAERSARSMGMRWTPSWLGD
jgi:predicted DsbA family dithiol-disulfide isomerase